MYTLIIIAALVVMLIAWVWSNNDTKKSKLDETVFVESTDEPVVEEQPTVVIDSKVVDLKEAKKVPSKKKPTSKKKSTPTKK